MVFATRSSRLRRLKSNKPRLELPKLEQHKLTMVTRRLLSGSDVAGNSHWLSSMDVKQMQGHQPPRPLRGRHGHLRCPNQVVSPTQPEEHRCPTGLGNQKAAAQPQKVGHLRSRRQRRLRRLALPDARHLSRQKNLAPPDIPAQVLPRRLKARNK